MAGSPWEVEIQIQNTTNIYYTNINKSQNSLKLHENFTYIINTCIHSYQGLISIDTCPCGIGPSTFLFGIFCRSYSGWTVLIPPICGYIYISYNSHLEYTQYRTLSILHPVNKLLNNSWEEALKKSRTRQFI